MDDEDELLADELGKVARIGMRIVGLDIFPRLATAVFRWRVRRAPKTVCELSLTAYSDVQEVRERIKQILAEYGELIDTEDPNTVRGILHLGRSKLHRALVTVTLKVRCAGTEVLVRGVFKEGWIKQDFAQRSARMVSDAVRGQFPCAASI